MKSNMLLCLPCREEDYVGNGGGDCHLRMGHISWYGTVLQANRRSWGGGGHEENGIRHQESL